MDKQKKIALVTGAEGNLGRAMAKKLEENNYHVVGTVHQSEYEYTMTGAADRIGIDLLSPEDCTRMIEEIFRRYGRMDVAVLTAGGFAMGNIAHTDNELLHHQLRLNFETAFNVVRPLMEPMARQQHGHVFFIGAVPALSTERGIDMVAYSLSKSLLFQFAGLVNASIKKTGIAASVVVPSIIDTPENRKAMPDADPTQWERPGQIADIILAHIKDASGRFTEVIKISEVIGH